MWKGPGRKVEITKRAMALIEWYEWPGNVREMENLIERMVIMADDDAIDADILPGHLSGQAADQCGQSPISRIEEIERKEILAALERNGWNQTRTAKELGLTLRQIGYRVRKFGFDKVVEEHKRGG
jgi:Nif-specific regulatory protein